MAETGRGIGGRLRRALAGATRAAAEEAATLLVRSVVAHVPASVTVARRVGL